METHVSDIILRPYAYGRGIEKIYDRVQGTYSFREPVMIICPNRMVIQGLENYWLKNAGGMIGLHLVTFDDFVRELTGAVAPMPRDILHCILHEQIQFLQTQGTFDSLGDSSFFESFSEEVGELFSELHGQGIRLEADEPGLFGDLGKIFERYEEFLTSHGLHDLGMVYQRAVEGLKSGNWKLPRLVIFGFDSYRPYEWEIIDCLIKTGQPLEIYHPMSTLDSKTLSQMTLKEFEKYPIKIEEFEPVPKNYRAKGIYGSQSIDVYKDLLLTLAKEGDLENSAIYTSLDKIGSELEILAEQLSIPMVSPLQSLKLSTSLLARDFRDYFLCLDLGKPGILNFLRSYYFQQVPKAESLINVLERMEFEDFEDLYDRVNRVQKIQLSGQEHQVFFDQLNYFKDLSHCRENLNFQGLIEETREILQGLPEEKILEEDKSLHKIMLEVVEDLDLYTDYLHSISRESFLNLFYKFLQRREDRVLHQEGVDLMNLDQGIGKTYKRIYMVNASIDWPKKKSKSFINNPSLRKKLKSLGYRPPEDDFNYLKGKAQVESLLATGEDLSFAWIGSEEDHSLILEEFFNMETMEKTQVKTYPMAVLSQESQKIQAHRRRVLESRMEKNSPYHGALKEEVGAILRSQMKSQALNATLLDRYVRCPFAAYVEKFLLPDYKMEVPGSMIHLETGNIYHRVLEETGGKVTDPTSVSKILRRHYLQSLLSQGKSPAEQEIDMDYLMTRLMKFIEEDQARLQDVKRDLGFKGQVFEERFEGEISGLKWRGSIDRIDQNEAGDEILIDYKKTSIPSIGDVLEARVWQLVIYAHIRRLQGHPVMGITYGSIEGSQFRSYLRNRDRIGQYGRLNRKTDLSEEDFENFFKDSLRKLDEVLADLGKMEFFPNPIQASNCISCLYRKVCRKEEAPWLN